MSFEIEKTLVASTKHVEKKDFDILDSKEYRWRLRDYDYGALVNLNDGIEALSVSGDHTGFSSELSEGFRLLVLYAVSLGCDTLKLDCDGPIYNDFPKYNW
tara:strand:- start:21 stop:323 length:303 start_codon:yes stop_codon:yes gene_type:complete